MKDANKEGDHIPWSAKRRIENEFVTAEEERKSWEMNLLRTSSVKSSLYTVYFYTGKICGLRLENVITNKGAHRGY